MHNLVRLFRIYPGGHPMQFLVVKLRYELGGQKVHDDKLAFQSPGKSHVIHFLSLVA